MAHRAILTLKSHFSHMVHRAILTLKSHFSHMVHRAILTLKSHFSHMVHRAILLLKSYFSLKRLWFVGLQRCISSAIYGDGHRSGTTGFIHINGNIFPTPRVGHPVNKLFNGQSVLDHDSFNVAIVKSVNPVHMLFDVVHIP